MRIKEVNPEAVELTEAKILVNFSEVKICVVEVSTVKMHTKASIRVIAIKVIITKAIMVYIITHVEIFNKAIIMASLEAEAMVMAEVITMNVVMVGPIIEAITTTSTISIMVMMMSTRQTNTVHHVHYAVAIITPPNIVLRENMISMTSLPQQQELGGSTEIEHTLYSHNNTISPEMNSFQKLEYIYQHFQDNEKIYESDPDLARYETDNTLYPHINNDIEYGLFEDVIISYYLESQIKDDFKCNQECYTGTQEKQ